MSLNDYFSFFTFLHSLLPLTWIDLSIALLLIIYLFSESVFTLIESITNTIKLIFSFVIALFAYPFLSFQFIQYLKIWRGTYDSISFISIFLLCFFTFSVLERFFNKKDESEPHYSSSYIKLVSGAISFLIIITIFSTVAFSIGTSQILSRFLLNSYVINYLFVWGYRTETNIRELIFSDSPNGLNVIGLDDERSSKDLYTSFKTVTLDEKGTDLLFKSINNLRLNNNRPQLERDENLAQVAEVQANDLASRAVLSRKDKNSLLIYDRLFENNIQYSQADELSVFAATPQLAYEAIANFSKSREKLMGAYQKIGIAVLSVDGKGAFAVIELVR